MRIDIRTAAPVALAALIAACSGAPKEGASAAASPSQPPVMTQASPSAAAGTMAGSAMGASAATAQLSPTQGNSVRGTVTFEPSADGLHVTAHIEGLTPGEHGFHLHQNGDCSAPDGSSAGDHWNPTQQPHGAPEAAQHHAGDLGNITADAGGMAHVDKTVHGIGLEGMQSVLGHAVIVHGKADDLKSQPSGNAGPRVACGVVGGGAGTDTGTASPAARRDPGE